MRQRNMPNYRERSGRGYGRFKKVYDIAMGVFYVVLGTGIFMADTLGFEFQIANSETFLKIFGGILVFYGVYRVYRGFKYTV